jgi:hypothetical protein
MTNTDLYALLSDPFPVEMERTVNKSGRSLTYLPIAEVINKMNKVIGVGNWSSEIVSVGRDALDPDWVVAHVRVTVSVPAGKGDGRVVATYDGVGGQQVKRKKSGEIVDLGDEFKGAVSDALKKSLQQIGLGLYLARTEDAIYADEAYEAHPAPAVVVPTPPPAEPKAKGEPKMTEEDKLWTAFDEHLSSMDKGEKAALAEWWADNYPGEPKPKRGTATKAQLKDCVAEILRIRLGATMKEE